MEIKQFKDDYYVSENGEVFKKTKAIHGTKRIYSI